ncbi:leo-1, partial [Pristionchus pacificus]
LDMSSSSGSDSEVSERDGGPAPAAAGAGSDSDSAPSHRSASPPPQRAAARDSGSGSDEDSSPRKRRVMSDSDESSGDERKPKDIKPKEENLFGDDSSDGEANERRRTPRGSGSEDEEGGAGGREQRRDYDEEEQQEEEEEAPPTIIEGEGVAVNMDIGSRNPMFVRLPNFLSVAKRPFDPSYYEEDDDDDALDAEGRNRLKLKVENTIRWRSTVSEDGEELRESNAKIVKWSDGTMSMHLGNEIFDVQVMPVSDHNHLYIRQGQGLVGQAVFNTKLNLRPHSTESVTHKKMTMTMAEKTRKSGQVKMISNVGNNPDAEKQDIVRKEEEALRAATRSAMAQGRSRLKNRYSGMSSAFLEGRGEDSDEESLGAIKGRYQRGGRHGEYSGGDRPLIGASDSDSDSGEGERRLKDAKDSDADSDDSDLRQKKQQKKQIVTSDEDSD